VSLRFGTSGIPLSSPRPRTVDGIRRARELGLGHLEMAWSNGVRMSDAAADAIAAAARGHDITLTAHAPYFVNLCGSREIVARSRARLVEAGRLGERCGARSFCFHAGFYGALDPAEASRRVQAELGRVTAALRRKRIRIDARAELTGKATQVGSLEEVLAWSAAVPGVLPCVDFAHRYARDLGRYNRYDDFAATLTAIETKLGRAALDQLHVHAGGIEYGPRGERRHEPLLQTRFRWRELLRALKDLRVGGWMVCESPKMEEDALLLQQTYRRMK
jgi:deoxyribonuclease-4